jgi:hypothetical protein
MFLSMSVATLPLMDDTIGMVLPFLVDTSSLAWRFYIGLDRIQYWITALIYVTNKDVRKNSGIQSVHRAMGVITTKCFTGQVDHIAMINVCLPRQIDFCRNQDINDAQRQCGCDLSGNGLCRLIHSTYYALLDIITVQLKQSEKLEHIHMYNRIKSNNDGIV